MTYDIDVIIPQFNQACQTEALLRSIAASEDRPRIILVDDGSRPEERNRAVEAVQASGLAHHLIFHERNQGFVRAANAGLAAAEAPYVVLQNNDTRVFGACYRRLRDALDRNTGAGAVGPITSCAASSQHVLKFKGERPDVWHRLDKVGFYKTSHEGRAEIAGRVCDKEAFKTPHYLAFFCVMLRLAVIRATGLLDEDFGPGYGDDNDYCDRLKGRGHSLIVALDAYVQHIHGATFESVYKPAELKAVREKNIRILSEKRRRRKGAL